jgi:hypothetical protein
MRRLKPLHGVALVVGGIAIVAFVTTCGASSDKNPANLGPDGSIDGASGDGFDLDGGGTCPGGPTVHDCSGTCVDTASDPSNCGACGNACGAGATCCSGGCNVTPSCDFSVASVDPSGIWQSGGDFVQLVGSGFAKGMKAYIADARAPIQVVDANHATLVTPPGPVGRVDLKLVLPGAKTTTMTKAFAYESGGLTTPWQTKPLSSVRGEFPGVAVMQDGRVLIAGGVTKPDDESTSLATAEIFTRTTDSLSPAKNTMTEPRWRNVAVTLLDGRVLVAGRGCGGTGTCTGDTADLFDPKTDTFTPSKGRLSRPREFPRAVLLVDGRVLIFSDSTYSGPEPGVDIYDPTTDAFTSLTPPSQPGGYAVRLRDGRALIVGGGPSMAAMTFDPDTNTFAPSGTLHEVRAQFTAHTLPDGRVIVIGGNWAPATDTIEFWDSASNAFTYATYKLTKPRGWHGSALVRDGTILILGGYQDGCTPTDTVDQIDPVKGAVTPFASLSHWNTELNAVTLLDGSILGVGGGECGASSAYPDLDFLPGAPGPR